jgi:hypothetical protein
MRERDVRRVVCLLSDEWLAKYDDLLGAYRRRFAAVTHAAIDDYVAHSASRRGAWCRDSVMR